MLKFCAEKESRYPGADISTDVEEAQAYDATGVNERIEQAVQETRGLVLSYGGQLPCAWFHAHSGGVTARAGEGLHYEKEEPGYARSVEGLDSADAPEDARAWRASFSAEQVIRAAEEAGLPGLRGIDTVSVGERGESGRAVTLLLNGKSVSAAEMRLALGASQMTLLTSLKIDGGKVIMAGKGYGHGVGMPQWGAYALARDGKSAREIVTYYFRNVTVEKCWQAVLAKKPDLCYPESHHEGTGGEESMNLERAMSRAWAEVDEDALLHNYSLAKSLCREDTAFICVVKANAYGLGLRRTVQTLRQAGAEWFSVAAPEEALQARQAAPDAHILLMGPAEDSYLPALIGSGISLTVGTEQDAVQASRAALSCGQPALVHVKLDTGLHRLGFTSARDALRIRDLPGLSFEGVYSHLALRSREQSLAQIRLFTAMADEIEAGGLHAPLRHLLDSIGLTRYPEYQLNGVRVGAFLYGNVPLTWDRFSEGKNVVTFKTRVTRVAAVPAGEGVGYDDTPLSRDTVVATLPVGYIDGYPRVLSRKGFVSVRGRRAAVLGLVCMDQMMIDVTDIPDVRQGDPVTLLGGPIPLQEYAAWGQLNRNECLGILGRRVPRVYLRGGRPVQAEAEMDTEEKP